MRREITYQLMLSLIVFAIMGCESLEDTYKDYKGDGKIRYTGKCTDVKLQTGWQRFVVNWKNSEDATIKNIKIKWSGENMADSVVLPGNSETFETPAIFGNQSYTFELRAVDEFGNESLPTLAYGRPFTQEHDLVKGFSKMINKFYFLRDRLILVFDDGQREHPNVTVNYTKQSDQKEQILMITAEMIASKYYPLSDIDISKPVKILRKAIVEGCLDEVVFEPYVLDPKMKVFRNDFMQEVKKTYNLKDLNDEFLHNTTELRLNYSLYSLEDLMYFPNLTKVILGGNRYMKEGHEVPLSGLENLEMSLFAIDMLKDQVEFESYNNHYGLVGMVDEMTEMGSPQLPKLSFLPTNSWNVKISPYTGIFEAKDLFDDNSETSWIPRTGDFIRNHEIVIDMQSRQSVQGFKIVQTNAPGINEKYIPEMVKIQFSDDGQRWNEAFYQLYNTLGTGVGEATVLYLPETTSTRYIKFIITDNIVEVVDDWYGDVNSECGTYIGDIMVF